METQSADVQSPHPQVLKVDLLDPATEPSVAALSSMMGAVQRAALAKSALANQALFARLRRETEAARARGVGDQLMTSQSI